MYVVLAILSAVAVVVAALFLVSMVLTWRVEQRNPPLGAMLRVGERQFHIMQAGETTGQTFVLLHGASSSARDIFHALGAALSPHGRVIAPDRPGHGHSSRLAGDQSLEAQAGAIWQLLDHLEVQNPVLVGHSWGGGLVAAMALSRPQNVAKLVLVAPVLRPWGGKVDAVYRVGAKPILGWLLCHILVPVIGRFKLQSGVQNVFKPAPVPPDYMHKAAPVRTLKPSRFRANAQDMSQLQAGVARLSLHYAKLTMPLVVFGGQGDDALSTHYHAQALTAAGATPKVVDVQGQGHMPHYGAVEQLLPLILAR